MVNHSTKSMLAPVASFLGRLARDRAANVLAIFAACIPPILILVGGGIDMSRAYMAQTSLQNACDAGVLAGRRAQTVSGVWTATEVAKANKMFNFNFNSTSQRTNASGTAFTPTDAGGGVISGTASTTIPTTIMKIFGTNTFSLSATCSAKFVISNIDVMMVLDTTGSMACNPDGSNCNSSSTSKIEGLKSAIRSFYYTLASSVPATGTRVRFGFVPYAGTVNMKNLVTAGDIPQGYLADTNTYQTQQFHFDQMITTGGTSSAPVISYETYASDIQQSDCDNYGVNAYPSSGNNPVSTGTPPGTVVKTTYSYFSWTKTGTSGGRRNSVDIGTCVRKLSKVTSTGQTVTGYSLDPTNPYRYVQDTVSTSGIKTGAAVNLATGVSSASTVPATGYTDGYYNMVELANLAGTANVTKTSYTWTGCIEERATVNSLISATNIPAGATDLDLTTAPSTADSTRWKPYVSQMVFDRGGSATVDTSSQKSAMTEYCVPAAQKFTTVDTSVPATVPSWIETYLGTLYAWGGTYHDIGMIWGARLANPNGIMATNVNAGNLSSVNRNLIFLTDGDMSPYCNALYSAYGLEYLDHRVAPSTTLTGTSCDNYLIPYNNGRFLAACQLAKNMGYTVWMIGFGQALTTEMTTCASSGRAYYASDNAALQAAFRTIAASVADLRIES